METRAFAFSLLSGFVSASGAAGSLSPLPAEKKPGEKVTVVIYGDNQSGFGHPVVHQDLVLRMREENPDLVPHTGNMVASGGRSEQWKQFLAEGTPLFSVAPLEAVPGDHDLSKTGQFRKFLGKADPAISASARSTASCTSSAGEAAEPCHRYCPIRPS